MAESLATRASLLMRLRDARDAAAWAEFVDLYAPLIHRFCRKQGLQDADAADLTQAALTQVFRAAGQFEYDPQRGSFRGWLFTMVRNRIRDFHIQQRRRIAHAGAAAGGPGLDDIPGPDGAADAQWEHEYRLQLFAAAARTVRRDVTAPTWRAFELTAVEGRPAAEAATELGLSVAAVYLARSRVMARIKHEVALLQEEPTQGPSS